MSNHHFKKNKKTINMDPKEKKEKEEELVNPNAEVQEETEEVTKDQV